MVNQDILEGLRLALSRGNNLEKSMLSFFNAGYDRKEIEEAARALYENPSQPLSHPEKPIPEEYTKPIQEIYQPIPNQPVLMYGQTPIQEIPEKESQQLISRYGEEPKSNKKLITILLVISLIILAALLIGIIVFKNQLVDFFGTLFS